MKSSQMSESSKLPSTTGGPHKRVEKPMSSMKMASSCQPWSTLNQWLPWRQPKSKTGMTLVELFLRGSSLTPSSISRITPDDRAVKSLSEKTSNEWVSYKSSTRERIKSSRRDRWCHPTTPSRSKAPSILSSRSLTDSLWSQTLNLKSHNWTSNTSSIDCLRTAQQKTQNISSTLSQDDHKKSGSRKSICHRYSKEWERSHCERINRKEVSNHGFTRMRVESYTTYNVIRQSLKTSYRKISQTLSDTHEASNVS